MQSPDQEIRDWRERLVSPAEAISTIRSGERVFVGSACATPRALLGALEQVKYHLHDVSLLHFLTDGAVAEDKAPRFRHTVFYVGSDVQPYVETDRVDYVPISVPQVHHLIQIGRIPIDTALIQVAPPDADGNCSLGVSVDITLSAVRAAGTVIAEINPSMPRTLGNASIPISEIDALTLVETPIIEYLHKPADDVARQVARYVARIIDDGSTLQVGLGRIPNEMLKFLANRRDLGIHSDVITEPMVELIESGAVTGARKTVNPGKVITSYCMGTRRLYDLVNDNPRFEFRPLEEVADPEAIAAQERMVSVSQAFALDLTGQVCADQFEGTFYGGVSSQPEFLRGSAAAKGGKAIVCLASTTDDGTQSRIRALLREGEGVTIARSDVHYVVTEYGVAYLFGKTIRERAIALIEIAHPDFREQLLEEAKRLGYVPAEQTAKSRSAYPAHEEREVELKEGRRVRLRPTRASDVDGIQQLFYSMSEENVYTRFFNNLKSLDVSRAAHLCSVDYENEMAFIAVTGEREHEQVVGNSCYYVNPSTNLADVAYMVRPEWQGTGLGSALQDVTIAYARAHGLRGFTADVLTNNKPMIKVFKKSGCKVESHLESGAYEVVILFDEPT
jgi:acyl-CoA hydrolase/GNAT superfamily N-acetyltransferase